MQINENKDLQRLKILPKLKINLKRFTKLPAKKFKNRCDEKILLISAPSFFWYVHDEGSGRNRKKNPAGLS
jgi:hypothetical protein